MFFADSVDIQIDFVLGLDRDVGTEGVVAGLPIVTLCSVIESKDFVSILLLLNPRQEIVRPISTVDSRS